MKLYEYDDIIATLYRAAETDEGVDPETGMVFDVTLLDKLEMERDKKIENAILYREELKVEIQELEDYIKRLQKRQKAKENDAEGLKRWIAYTLRNDGKKAFDSVKIHASVTIKDLDKPDIVDRNKIPEEYRNYSRSWNPAKTAIKEALKNGIEVPGARLVDSITLTVK